MQTALAGIIDSQGIIDSTGIIDSQGIRGIRSSGATGNGAFQHDHEESSKEYRFGTSEHSQAAPENGYDTFEHEYNAF